jgi:glutamate decarboxylase
VPIHIDGASGAMVAPFLQPELRWDFRLERVHSISTSGHKYGLVYPGVGWVVWRERRWLPEDLVFDVSYLGGSMPTFALNFSRPGAQVLLQYYQFLRLGRAGFTEVQRGSQAVARHLAAGIASIGAFELWNDGSDIPVFAWRLKPGHTDRWTLHHLSDRLRMRGWLVPAYPLPDALSDRTVQRIVVRNGLSGDLADRLLDDITAATAYLDRLSSPMPAEGQQPSFHH